MNQAAIESTAEIIERIDKLLRRKLTEKQFAGLDENIAFDTENPDKDVRRILGADYLGCSDSEAVSLSEATEIIDRIASLCGRPAAEVSKILWSYCSTGYGEVCTVHSPKCWLCDASEFCVRAQQDQKYARLLDDNGHAIFRIELKKLYELWIPGESEEYEYLHVKRSSTHPEYVIIVMTTASDQGGIVAVVDMASGEIVHYHDGEYAIVNAINNCTCNFRG